MYGVDPIPTCMSETLRSKTYQLINGRNLEHKNVVVATGLHTKYIRQKSS